MDCSQVTTLFISFLNLASIQAEDFYSLNADVKAAGEAATELSREGRREGRLVLDGEEELSGPRRRNQG